MVSGSVLSGFIVAVVMTTVVPVVLIIVLALTKKIHILPLIVGMAAFFISQIVLRIPLLGILSTQSWYIEFSGNVVLSVLMLSLSAGIFEESARLCGTKLLKNHRSYKDAISFGLGHGLCEVVLLIGMTHINNVILSLAINGNEMMSPLIAALPAETLDVITAQLSQARVIDIYAGIVERIPSVSFHIFATVLVFQGVIKKKVCYYVLAILAHTVINFSAVMLMRASGTIITEVALLIIGGVTACYVIKVRNHYTTVFEAGK